MLIHPKARYRPYTSSSGGWGSARSVMEILWREQALTKATSVLFKQNKPDGFACVSCAWAKPAHPHTAEFCENGAKATAWELTAKRLRADFFQTHSVSELAQWSDHDLESGGR